MLLDLFTSSNFTDVTFVCDDQTQFKAHKLVLSACSPLFRSILSGNTHSQFIYLRGIAKEEMESVLQFMYLGEATFHEERMKEFLNVANDLDIKEIAQNITIENDNPSLELGFYKISESSRKFRKNASENDRKFSCDIWL